MKQKSIIIIGGGIAGLSAGCYARMNGYKTTIYEKHNIPGGLCTAWKRKDYIIDCCIHWLVGAGKTTYFHKFWKELGIVQKDVFFFHEEFLRIKGKSDQELIVYSDADAFEKHLLEISPADNKLIKKMVKIIKIFGKYELPVDKSPELYSFIDKIRLLIKHFPIIYYINKYKNISMKDFANKFKNKFLREYFPKIFDLQDFSMTIFFFHLGWLNKKSSGYHLGGSLKFSEKLAKRYIDLGGEIKYNINIKKIITENNQAVGVMSDSGETFFSDIVISAIDKKTVLFNMLEKKFLNNELINKLDKLETFPPLVQISLGLARDLRNTPHMRILELQESIKINNQEFLFLKVEHSSFDNTITPEGKSTLKVLFFSNYDYWEKLYEDRPEYNKRKKKFAGVVIDRLEEFYPGISNQIEMIDVATPITFKRYTGNHNGTWEGWLIDTKSININLKNYLSGLKNFYFTGHWIAIGGGLPLVTMSSRNLIQKICRIDRKKFCTTEV